MSSNFSLRLSQNVQKVLPSATLAMNARAKALQAAGVDVLAMSAGEPDFDTPEHIKQAAKEAIARGESKYTPVAGTLALRQAVVAWAKKIYDLSCKSEQVLIGAGGKQVLFNACAALLDPGDIALFAAPYWVSYPDMVRFTGAEAVPVYAAEGALALPEARDFAKVLQTAGSRVRLVILNSPSNPTGAVYSEEQLQEFAELLRAYPEVFIITDDIYYGLVFERPFVSLAMVAPDLLPRMLIASGVSKTYAMTGWRIGFGIGPKKLIDAMADLQGASTSGACSIAQAAALAALTGPDTELVAMKEVFNKRRTRLLAGLQRIPQLQVFKPEGAFYAFVKVSAYFNAAKQLTTSGALCEYLLEKAHLALVPGDAFGADDYVRISFACSEQVIDEALKRLETGLLALKS